MRGKKISPFMIASVAIHLGLCFLYVRAVSGARFPVPRPPVYTVSLVELPPEEKVEEKKPEPVKVEKKVEKIPEKPRPRKPKKKEEPKKEPEKKPEAEPAKEETPKRVVSGAVTVEAENFPFAYYLALIESRIGGRWAPPPGLVSAGTAPRATVRFEILESGKVRNAHIVLSSGVSFFDTSALRAVLDSDPFPPLPEGFPGKRLGVNFVFEYKG